MRKQKPTDSVSPTPPAETEAVRWVNQLLLRAIKDRASDVHIDPTQDGFTVGFQTDGGLHTVVPAQQELQSEIVSRIKTISGISVDEEQVPQEGRYAAIVDGRKVAFRVSTLTVPYGEAVVVRVVDHMRENGYNQ